VRRRGGVFALGLAVLFGLLGSFMAFVYLMQQKQRAAIAAQPAMVPVVVAAADLTFGTTLRSEHVDTVMYPEASVPVGAFHDPDSLVGQTTKVFVTTREPVLATKLSSMGGGLSIRIPLTMRATSMNVNVVSGVSGFVLPGDRVDVLVVIDRPGQAGNAITRTILQNVEVLAAGQKTEQKGGDPVTVQSVTLIVDPEGAEKLALGLHEGKLHLVLRNPADTEIASVRSFSTSEVLADHQPAAVKPKPKAPSRPQPAVTKPPVPNTKVKVIRGTKVDEQEPAVKAELGMKEGSPKELPQ
jgi:pilus assembly protein CpaB